MKKLNKTSSNLKGLVLSIDGQDLLKLGQHSYTRKNGSTGTALFKSQAWSGDAIAETADGKLICFRGMITLRDREVEANISSVGEVL